jgi:hypothetical protein
MALDKQKALAARAQHGNYVRGLETKCGTLRALWS